MRVERGELYGCIRCGATHRPLSKKWDKKCIRCGIEMTTSEERYGDA